jgi:putative transposase
MQLEPPAIKELYSTVLEEAKLKYDFRIEAFCLMNSHVHLVIEPGIDEDISRIMQWINGVFAMRYNRKMGIEGKFWGERFYSRIIQRLKDYLRTLEYVEENPVRANLVRHAADWLFGSARHRLDRCYDILDAPG